MPVKHEVIETTVFSNSGDFTTTITKEKIFHEWRGDYYSNTDLVGEMGIIKEFISHLQEVVKVMEGKLNAPKTS